MQKYPLKSIPLEEAIKLIQIAERARQGRLRAIFMKQIFLREYRAKQARLLGEKGADVGAAALHIQKVRMGVPEGTQPWAPAAGAGSSGARNAKILPLAKLGSIPERLIILPGGNH